MLDVAREARWGRCAESPGEDPLLGAAFAVAMVEGYQGDDLAGAAAVMATAKHLAGYGLSESGRDYKARDASHYRMQNVVQIPLYGISNDGVVYGSVETVRAAGRERAWHETCIGGGLVD